MTNMLLIPAYTSIKLKDTMYISLFVALKDDFEGLFF